MLKYIKELYSSFNLKLQLQKSKSFRMYSFSYFFNTGISLAILPVLRHFFTKEDYGEITAYYAVNNKIPQQNFFFNTNAVIYLTGALLIFADNYFDFTGRVVIFKIHEALFLNL